MNEEIKNLAAQGYSTRQIAKKINKSQTTVRYWLKKFGQKTKTTKTHLFASDEQIKSSIKESVSVAQALRKLKRSVVGPNYKWLYKQAKRLEVDLSHFKGQGHGTCKQKYKIPFEKVLIKDSPFVITKVRKKGLIRQGLLKNVCQICGQKPIWNGRPLVLRLDHINGDCRDHRIQNLRLVCPNCDSQLPTFCGRNIKNKHRRSTG